METVMAAETTMQPKPWGLGFARATWRSPIFWLAVTLWIALNLTALALSDGVLPFDRPALAGLPFSVQMAFPTAGLLEIFALMAVVYLLTMRRAVPDMAARAPARGRAAIETVALLAYAMAGQVGGWYLGP